MNLNRYQFLNGRSVINIHIDLFQLLEDFVLGFQPRDFVLFVEHVFLKRKQIFCASGRMMTAINYAFGGRRTA